MTGLNTLDLTLEVSDDTMQYWTALANEAGLPLAEFAQAAIMQGATVFAAFRLGLLTSRHRDLLNVQYQAEIGRRYLQYCHQH